MNATTTMKSTNNTDAVAIAAILATRVKGRAGFTSKVISNLTGLSVARVSKALNAMYRDGDADYTIIRAPCFNGKYWR